MVIGAGGSIGSEPCRQIASFRTSACSSTMRGVPERKLQTIPDCVDVDLYRPLPRRNAFAEEYGLLDDFVVLYGGNLGLAQDLESILFAAGALGHLPIRFVIVGDGLETGVAHARSRPAT